MINSKIYKFIGFSNNSIKGLDKKKIESLQNDKIFTSKYTMLNDPYESQYYFMEPSNYLDKSIYEALKSNILIASFTSEDYNCSPMWAHYANNHYGICLEFEIINEKFLRPILYIGEQQSMNQDIKKVSKTLLQNGSNKVIIEKEISDKNIRNFLSKDQSWKYENEIRYINLKVR
ncbi:hypothetical protein F3D3_1726 [Fusibacter sp. 3D3]|nr:hypothetical protein F3D3_1726 [Fusibacter sp. 3D3]